MIARIQKFFETTIRDLILCRSEQNFIWLIMMQPPLIILMPIILAVFATIADVVETASFPVDARRVPTFYVPKHRYSKVMHILLLMALGTIFGVIHCAGWELLFPTDVEQILWRFASLLVTIIPIAIVPFLLIGVTFFRVCLIVRRLGLTDLIFRFTNLIHRLTDLTDLIDVLKFTFHSSEAITAIVPLSMYFMYVYASARLVLLGLALALLRHQPPGAFIAVNWTKFYPHIF